MTLSYPWHYQCGTRSTTSFFCRPGTTRGVFISYLDQAQLTEETKAELDGLLTSSLVSVNQTAHVDCTWRPTRREGIIDSSVLDRASELVLRGQPIGGAGSARGRCVQRAARETQKSLLFQVAVGRLGKPKGAGEGRIRPTIPKTFCTGWVGSSI